jgi:hypothetical protein
MDEMQIAMGIRHRHAVQTWITCGIFLTWDSGRLVKNDEMVIPEEDEITYFFHARV